MGIPSLLSPQGLSTQTAQSAHKGHHCKAGERQPKTQGMHSPGRGAAGSWHSSQEFKIKIYQSALDLNNNAENSRGTPACLTRKASGEQRSIRQNVSEPAAALNSVVNEGEVAARGAERMKEKDGEEGWSSGFCNPPRSPPNPAQGTLQPALGTGLRELTFPALPGPSPAIPCPEHQFQQGTKESIPRADLANISATALGAPKDSVLRLSYQETILRQYCCLPQSFTRGFASFSFIKKQKTTLTLVKYNFLNSENRTKR